MDKRVRHGNAYRVRGRALRGPSDEEGVRHIEPTAELRILGGTVPTAPLCRAICIRADLPLFVGSA